MSNRKSAAAILAATFDVVTAIIGYAAALMHPVVQAARRAYRMACAGAAP